MIIHAASNEAPTISDPSVLQTPRGQAPLGIFEGAQKFIPYQQGFIADLWQLGYIAQKYSSLYSTAAFIVISILFFLLLRRRVQNLSQLILLYLLTMLAVGPVLLNAPFGIESLYGIVRFGGLLTAFALALRNRQWLVRFSTASPLLVPLLLYTAAVIASFPRVLNAASFLDSLKLLLTGYVYFVVGFLSLHRFSQLRVYATFFSFIAGVISFLMLLAFAFQNLYKSLISAIYPLTTYLKLLYDLGRGRLTPIFDIEFLGSFVLQWTIGLHRGMRIVPAVFLFLLSLMVLFSNARYRVVVLLFSLLAYLVLVHRLSFFKRAVVPFLFLIVVYLGISNLVFEANVFERFLLQDPTEDRLPLQVRVQMATDALRMAAAFPLTGVGFGNYGEYITFKYRYHGVAFDPYYRLVLDTYRNPHNWYLSTLAETGILGLAALGWLVWKFFQEDRFLLASRKGAERELLLLFMIPTWGFLLGNLITNLHTSLTLVILFWFFRGLIHRVYLERVT